jgi:hypothetical protein
MRFQTQLKVDKKYGGIKKKSHQNSLQMSNEGVKQVFAANSLMWSQNVIIQTCQHGSSLQSCKKPSMSNFTFYNFHSKKNLGS